MDSPVRIVPFKREHYERAVGPIALSGMTSRKAGVIYEAGGPAFTGLIGDDVAGCAGIMVFWPGVGEAWALLTELGLGYPVLATELVRTGLDVVITGLRLRRVQADVSAEFDAGRRWIARLGFFYESRMPKYGPAGEDFIRYVRFP